MDCRLSNAFPEQFAKVEKLTLNLGLLMWINIKQSVYRITRKVFFGGGYIQSKGINSLFWGGRRKCHRSCARHSWNPSSASAAHRWATGGGLLLLSLSYKFIEQRENKWPIQLSVSLYTLQWRICVSNVYGIYAFHTHTYKSQICALKKFCVIEEQGSGF